LLRLSLGIYVALITVLARCPLRLSGHLLGGASGPAGPRLARASALVPLAVVLGGKVRQSKEGRGRAGRQRACPVPSAPPNPALQADRRW